jgi:hypothetical protein
MSIALARCSGLFPPHRAQASLGGGARGVLDLVDHMSSVVGRSVRWLFFIKRSLKFLPAALRPRAGPFAGRDRRFGVR